MPSLVSNSADYGGYLYQITYNKKPYQVELIGLNDKQKHPKGCICVLDVEMQS
jgi:hypothetical protein